MSIYTEIELITDKYYNADEDVYLRSRYDENDKYLCIDEEIQQFLEDAETYDPYVDIITCFECPSMTVYSISWSCLIEGEIYRDHFVVYSL